MACRTLLRRKTQLDLLKAACEQRSAAHLSLRGSRSTSRKIILVEMGDDVLGCLWSDDRIPEAECPGRALEVVFEFDGERLIFQTLSQGTLSWETGDGRTYPGLLLNLPLRVERARRRRQFRLEPPDDPPLECLFTQVVDERRQFRARITDINEGGIGVVARTNEVAPLYTGDLYWTTLSFPDLDAPVELVARLIHLRPIRHTDQLAMGWSFQPGEDRTRLERYLRRLETLLGREVGQNDDAE